ncbi:PAS domain S-box protein [Leptolyngbya sp. FACHB-671]|uniref:PAS domain S-box protein n=1 Tax=Leptolyngbya sp. FACHB-671 TaxID=2692812 RepID=UPI001688DC2F|nr:PAS domain S-box protein [Leptolyngbya sp. FACHB-671]MBD2070263.1 PAS domain S-box protein [Leptolyngbya sp. FACHB-671]
MTNEQAVLDQLFAGGGEMGALMRSRFACTEGNADWSQTSLGLPEHWSQSLKTALRIVLTSRQPMFVWWGEDLINLYNDAYSSLLQNKHPAALGLPASRVWPELWDQLQPLIESAIRKNEGTFDEASLFIMLRKGYLEETYVTFSYSPIPDDHGGTGGIFCACTDDTQRIVGERQLALLQELAARTADARTFDEVCTFSASCLETNPYDLPFAMIYLIEPEQQQIVLAGTSSIDRDHPAVPQAVAFNNDSVWQLADVVRTQKACLITDLEASFDNLPTGAWQQMPHQAVSIPIAASGQTGKAGILVVGLNPFRLFDGNYREFIDLVAGQISARIANAEAYEAERKRAEALAELDRAKTVFFSNVSHEFRTPLTLMLGPLEDALASLEEQGSGRIDETPSPYLPAYSPTLKHQLQVAHRNAQRLLKLVNTLLDFARIEAGRIGAVYEPTDLAMLTTDLAGVFRSAIERAGLRLRVDCPPLPQLVYVDREMWEKIVLNLLSNAFKFTSEGEIVVSLRWEERRMLQTSSHVILEVRDMGTGIPAEELPHIFQRFHRVKGAAGRSYEGSGIGLSLVQELVKLHGGSIRVSSVVGQGTCFTISIPTGYSHLPGDRLQLQHGETQLIGAERSFTSIETRATPHIAEALRWLPDERSERVDEWMSEAEYHPSTRPLIYPSTHSPALPARILLADDNADMRNYMRRLLNQQYEVEVVSDGVAALAAIRQQMPHLVLTDVMMPRLDGFGLLQALRANPDTQQIPIILLSAQAGEESQIEGLAAGADDYLIKPFSARELLARVEATLKMARMRQEAAQQERELRLISEAAQQQAEDAYNRINRLLESMTDAFTALDRDWRITYQNSEAQRLNRKPATEVLGKTHWEEWPASVGTNVEHQYRRAMAEQIPVHFEHHYYLPPSDDIWLEIHAYPSEEGLGIFYRDITARKQSEEALRVAHQRLTYHVMNSPLAVMEFDSEARVVQWSPQAENVFGWKSQEVLGKRLIDMGFVHAEDEAAARREVIETLVKGDEQSKTMYNRNYTKDGSIVYCEWYNSVLRNEAGELISILSLALDVTDRKQAEEALRESEERFRAIVNQATAGIAQCNMSGRFILVNQKYCEITGYSREELLHKRIQDITHPDDLPHNLDLYQRLITQKTDFAVEKRYIRSDGSEVWVNNSVSPVRDAFGHIQSIVAIVLDISDRKRAEIALQESEAKFRAVFDQMYQFLGLLTPDGMLLEINQNPLTFANVEREAVIGKPFWEFPSWNATAELQEIAKTLVAQAAAGQLFHQEVNILDASSNLHTFDISAKPIYAIETHQILWVIVEGRDISALVRLQGALRSEQERSLQLITSSVDGIVAFDADGCCTLWNPAMEQMTGLRQEDVMGRRGVDVFAVLLDAKTLQGFHPGIEKTVTTFDFHFTHPKTRQRQWIEARYSPLHGGSETHNGGLLMVRDVTQQRELERMKREFISIISHEIRTPLSSIRGALGLVATGVLDDDPQTAKEMLGIANNNIERLVRLVNDVLALNRLESGQVELKKQWCEAATLVQQAFSSVPNLAEANQVALRSSTGNIQVWADPDWLVQVLVNLINNAVKFSPAGTTVSVNVEPQPQQVLFRVTDQGRGIPSEKLEAIFGQFQQVNMSDSRQKGGTGLGLSICRLIVQLHGGRIWAESELGRGSKFYFTLSIPD